MSKHINFNLFGLVFLFSFSEAILSPAEAADLLNQVPKTSTNEASTSLNTDLNNIEQVAKDRLELFFIVSPYYYPGPTDRLMKIAEYVSYLYDEWCEKHGGKGGSVHRFSSIFGWHVIKKCTGLSPKDSAYFFSEDTHNAFVKLIGDAIDKGEL